MGTAQSQSVLYESRDLSAHGEPSLRSDQYCGPVQSAKEKLPYIEDGTRVVADSGFILKFEENLYWAVLYWIEESIYTETRKVFFGAVRRS